MKRDDEVHVTQIIGEVLGGYEDIAPEILEFAAKRGTMVHELCDMEDDHDVLEESVAPELAGYLAAYRAFLRDFAPHWTHRELKMSHPSGHVGTLDRYGMVVRAGFPDIWVLSELKTTATIMPQVDIQLTAYEDLLKQQGLLCDELWAIQLRPNGTYRRKICVRNLPTWLSCLNVFYWRKNHG